MKTMGRGTIFDIAKFQFCRKVNFTLKTVSDEDIWKYKSCADECAEIMAAIKNKKDIIINPFIISWCNYSRETWFHELYYELWQRSVEINILINLVTPYLLPTFLSWSILQITILSILLLWFRQLRKTKVFWLFILWYCLFTGSELVIVKLLFNTFSKLFPRNNFFCRSQRFISTTLSSIPNWILTEALFNQCLVSLQYRNLPPVENIGATIMIVSSAMSLAILNAHSLWLYSVDQLEKTCNIHIHSQFFVEGYPIYLKIIENIIPGVIIITCVGILIYCQLKPSTRDNDQVKAPLFLGINYICFNMPSLIYWFMSYSSKPIFSWSQFNELKMNALMRDITDILANQSNFFILLIVYSTSSMLRSTSQKYFHKILKRVRASLKPRQPPVVMVDISSKDQSELALPIVKIVDLCD